MMWSSNWDKQMMIDSLEGKRIMNIIKTKPWMFLFALVFCIIVQSHFGSATCPNDNACPPVSSVGFDGSPHVTDYVYDGDPYYESTDWECQLIATNVTCDTHLECQGMGSSYFDCRDWDPFGGQGPSRPIECHYGMWKFENYFAFDFQANFGSLSEAGYEAGNDNFPLGSPDGIPDACQDGHDNDCNGLCDATGCCEAQAVNCSICSSLDCRLASNEDLMAKYRCESDGYTWSPTTKAACEAMFVEFCDWTSWTSGYPDTGCAQWSFVHGTPYCVDAGWGYADQATCTAWGLPWVVEYFDWLEPDPSCAAAVPSNPKLIFRNGDGTGTPANVAVIGSNGVASFHGTVTQGWTGSPGPTGEDFVLRNSAGVAQVLLQRSTGNLYLRGSMYQSQGTLDADGTAGRDFIIRNSGGDAVAFFDSNGNFYTVDMINQNVASP